VGADADVPDLREFDHAAALRAAAIQRIQDLPMGEGNDRFFRPEAGPT
jgi:hypothetical protein